LTCSSFSDFVSKSKIPPKFGFAGRQIGEQGGEGIDAFSFHDVLVFYWSIEPWIIPERGPMPKRCRRGGPASGDHAGAPRSAALPAIVCLFLISWRPNNNS
jgi:hypothetical protein